MKIEKRIKNAYMTCTDEHKTNDRAKEMSSFKFLKEEEKERISEFEKKSDLKTTD